MSRSEFLHNSARFDVPNRHHTTIIARDNLLKSQIEQCKCHWVLVTCLNFLLGFKWPEIDLAAAHKDTLADFVEQ